MPTKVVPCAQATPRRSLRWAQPPKRSHDFAADVGRRLRAAARHHKMPLDRRGVGVDQDGDLHARCLRRGGSVRLEDSLGELDAAGEDFQPEDERADDADLSE